VRLDIIAQALKIPVSAFIIQSSSNLMALGIQQNEDY
jgi:hypothetical protein